MSLSPLYGAGLTIASRLLSSDFEVDSDSEWMEVLSNRVEDLEEWIEITKNLDLDDPVSWARTGTKAAIHVLDIKKPRSAWDWTRQNDYRLANIAPPFIREILSNHPRREVVFSRDNGTVYRIPLAEDYCITLIHFPTWSEMHIKKDTEEKCKHLIGCYLWEHWNSNAISVDYVNDEVSVNEMNLLTTQYYGQLSSVIDAWQRYLDEGVRRNVLLHGDIGTGKSTLAMEAARMLSRRTVFIRQDFCANAPTSIWERLLDTVEPEMIIMDEVDKIGEQTLDSRLKMFEEGYCNVPLVVMTSNNLDDIPKPMRRPGRIDQTIEFSAPSEEERRKIILDLADREGVDLPAEYIDGEPDLFDHIGDSNVTNLSDLMVELSAAHVVEFLRRYKVEGEMWEVIEYDITFEIMEDNPDEATDELDSGRVPTKSVDELADMSLTEIKQYDGIRLEEN